MPDPIAPVPTVSTSAIEAPGGAAIQTINAAEPKASAVANPIKEAQVSMPEPKKLSVKEYLARKGDTDSKISLEKIEAKARPRNPDGTFVKVTQPKSKPAAKSDPASPATGSEPEPVAATALPPPVNKIKVGDREMTEEEVAAHIAKLEEAAKPKPAVPDPAPVVPANATEAAKEPEPAPVVETPEELAAKETSFINEQAKHFTPTQEQFDDMLATGNPKVFGEMIAKGLLEARKFLANSVNPIFDRMERSMDPVLKQQDEIRAYQAENDFLAMDDHKDIAASPNAHKAIREAGQFLHTHYDRLQRLISANAANPEEIALAKSLENPEQWRTDVAHHARRIIAQTTPVAVAPVPTPPAVHKPTPRPLPPSGQPTGAGGSTAPVSAQQSVIARVAKLR